jgi:hypothetical protein
MLGTEVENGGISLGRKGSSWLVAQRCWNAPICEVTFVEQNGPYVTVQLSHFPPLSTVFDTRKCVSKSLTNYDPKSVTSGSGVVNLHVDRHNLSAATAVTLCLGNESTYRQKM